MGVFHQYWKLIQLEMSYCPDFKYKLVNGEHLLINPRSSLVVYGPSLCGKTTLIYNLLKHRNSMFNEESPKKVLYCYGIYQPFFIKMKDTIEQFYLCEGLPDINELKNFCDDDHNIVIIDDLSHKLVNNPDGELMFTQYCHHMNISVVFVLHNLYQQGKCSRTIALNTKYMILFKSPRDMTQVQTLSRQCYPHNPKHLLEAYRDATSTPYGYLLVDFTPHVPDEFRLRTKILPQEEMIIYIPNK